MTVEELKEKLEEMPDDAVVMMKRSTVGEEQWVESVTFEKGYYRLDGKSVVWLHDTWE